MGNLLSSEEESNESGVQPAVHSSVQPAAKPAVRRPTMRQIRAIEYREKAQLANDRFGICLERPQDNFYDVRCYKAASNYRHVKQIDWNMANSQIDSFKLDYSSILCEIKDYDFTRRKFHHPYSKVDDDIAYKRFMKDVLAQKIIGLDIECHDKNFSR